ncbi:hypothetical protein [Paenibacillus thalictri]|uniref:Tetratricopeptide repeat protein n=1 Tax=Paenibacillus thalictri TaxID=2527873 RepID=A0A4Q9DP17_9BACL|nr:hypothetical protein [Paenibacillus thalictri]TBL76649.1 hypothetical protein EYB31_19690 [Paenibacillus thalictri]
MSELAILLFQVDDGKLPLPEADNRVPIVLYHPDIGAGWQEVKTLLENTGAPKVLLQFSNETISVPAHHWKDTDWRRRRHVRLYDAAEMIRSESPLDLIRLTPELPLPGLRIDERSVDSSESGKETARMLYFFSTRNWEQVETLLTKDRLNANELFALSCLYDKTNRFEEAYAASLEALAVAEEQTRIVRAASADAADDTAAIPFLDPNMSPDPQHAAAARPALHSKPLLQLVDLAKIWLAHGLHAAKCGHEQQAVTAFQMAFAKKNGTEPLYMWADELMRRGRTAEEAYTSIDKWLGVNNNEELHIRLLHRIGLFEKALEKLDRLTTPAPQLTCERFDCLIRTGRFPEAAAQLQGTEPYEFPSEKRISQLLADGCDITAAAAGLEQTQLQALQERAVTLRLFVHAETLEPLIAEPLSFAFALFRNGYVMRAATRFLQALREQRLTPEGYRCLGEILYHRGAYEQASGMLEYVLSLSPDDASLRTAAALAGLRQSEALLNESMHIFPSSVFLREEAEKVTAGIKRMEQSGAMTRWCWEERANFHA